MNEKRKIGLFFGSFNPIHNGHIAIAEYFRTNTDLEEIWFVVSPQNPLKNNADLLPDSERLELVQLALCHHSYFTICDAEFSLPKPSYTIDTLQFLSNQYPQNQFVIIIGSDNLAVFSRWKEYRKILDQWHLYVYNRTDFQDVPFKDEPHVSFFKAPLLPVSSSMIREKIRKHEDFRTFVSPSVADYLTTHRCFL